MIGSKGQKFMKPSIVTTCLFIATSELRIRLTLLVLAVLVFQAAPLHGQALYGTILGTITDSSHAVMGGVRVTVTEAETNFRRSDSSNESGFFVFSNLDPGTYRVEVEHPGFRKVVRTDIGLTPNTTIRADVELTPGEVTEVVNVTAGAPLLQTDRADTGGKIEGAQLQMPMLHNRNYQGLLMLVPGVQKSYRSNSAFFNSQEHLQSVVNGLD